MTGDRLGRLVWICAICDLPQRDEPPVREKQHLFPGCGGECGLTSRGCAKCVEGIRTTSGDDFEKTLESCFVNHHERHHRQRRSA